MGRTFMTTPSMESQNIAIRYDQSGLTGGRGQVSRFSRLVLQPVLTDVGWPNASLTILYCSEERIRDLNRRYRDLDAPTDVLSFPAVDDPKELKKEAEPYLGDLAICLPYTARSALAHNREPGEEVALLLVHGLLHLMGWTHETVAKERAMWQEQDRLLRLSRDVPRPPLNLSNGIA